MSRCCAVLVNFKNVEKTIGCAQSLLKGTVVPDCIYIVDNATSKENQKQFTDFVAALDVADGDKVKFIFNEKNLGFAAGCNQGIKANALGEGSADFVWLLNNDTIADERALEELLKKARETGAAITGSKILDAAGKYSGGVGRVHPFFASVSRVPEPADNDCEDCDASVDFSYVEGSSMLISARCFETIGLLPEDYFLYFEECDYCFRAKAAGLTLAWATKSLIFHDIGSSTGSEQGKGGVPYFIDCLMIRNRIRFARRNGFPLLGIRIGLLISLGLRFKRMQWNRILKILGITLSQKSFKSFILKNGGYIE